MSNFAQKCCIKEWDTCIQNFHWAGYIFYSLLKIMYFSDSSEHLKYEIPDCETNDILPPDENFIKVIPIPMLFWHLLKYTVFCTKRSFKSTFKPQFYRKVPKFSDTKKLCCKLPKIQTQRSNLRVFHWKDANGGQTVKTLIRLLL